MINRQRPRDSVPATCTGHPAALTQGACRQGACHALPPRLGGLLRRALPSQHTLLWFGVGAWGAMHTPCMIQAMSPNGSDVESEEDCEGRKADHIKQVWGGN